LSFGKSAVDGGHTVNRDAGNEGVGSGQDPSDPEVIAAIVTQRAVTDSCSPTAMRFDEQVTVAEHSPNHSPNALQTLSAVASMDASTTLGNLGDADPAGPTQGVPTSSQGNLPSSQPSGGANAGGDPNSNDSNGNGGNQGGSGSNDDLPGPGPAGNCLDKLVFTCSAVGVRPFAALGHQRQDQSCRRHSVCTCWKCSWHS